VKKVCTRILYCWKISVTNTVTECQNRCISIYVWWITSSKDRWRWCQVFCVKAVIY